MESPSSDQGGLRGELRGDAQAVTDTAKERLHSEVDSRKGDAASQAKTLSSALTDAAGKLDPNTPTWLKSALEQGARSIQRFAETVEQKDSRQLTRDVQQLARQNPGTFLAACALAGFAAARVFKAGTAGETGTGYSGAAAYQPPAYQPPSQPSGYAASTAERYALNPVQTGGVAPHDACALSGSSSTQPTQFGT